MSSVRLVRNAKCRQSGHSSACGAEQAGAADDQPPAAVDGLGDLRLAVVGVVDRLPGVLGDRGDRGGDGLGHPHADRVLPVGPLEALEHLDVPEPRVGAQQLDAGRAGTRDARDQLVGEAQHPLLGVRGTLAQADVQRLARVGAGREDRVVAEQLRVAVGGALLEPAADLSDEAVDVDHQPPVAWAGAGLPGALERYPEQPVELAHVPERERAQKRSQRRWRRQPAAEQSPRPPGPQHVAVVEAVGAEHHREQQRHHLATRVRRARPVAPQPHRTLRERLDPQPPSERRDQRDPGVTYDPLVVELDRQAVQSDRPRHPAPYR